MIGFRVDANEEIATGHLMRCISIAKACRRQGEDCIFFLAREKETERLSKAGFPYRILNTDYREMERELPQILRVTEEEGLSWLVVDSYQASVAYLAQVQKAVPVLYIDDMREEFYPVSAVLQYVPGTADYTERYQASGIPLLQGFSYAPLREEFMTPKEKKREKSILITTGGTDTYNVAGKVLEFCLEKPEFSAYVFHVIVGSMNTHAGELERLADGHPQMILHRNISNMSDYMSSCEAAVSAGGTTLLELCACRTPTVCFSFADNQTLFAEEMQRLDAVRYAGDARFDREIGAKVAAQLLLFTASAGRRSAYADRMGKLTDGKGADRIAAFMSSDDTKTRQERENDYDSIRKADD